MEKKQIGYKVTRQDNVATMMQDTTAGEIILAGDVTQGETAFAKQSIPFGHKVALTNIPKGAEVIKYGAPIGVAREDIAVGDYVHLHNLMSKFDDYSSSFDPETADDPEIEYAIYDYE